MQNDVPRGTPTDEHNKKLADEAAHKTTTAQQNQDSPSPPEQPEPTDPKPVPGPEPPEGAKVIRIWRTEDGKVYLNDADLGPGPTFDLLNWAQLTVKMPFFYREMSNELVRMVTFTTKQLKTTIKEHEKQYHHREVAKDAHPDDTSASPGVPEDVQRDVPESQPSSPADKH